VREEKQKEIKVGYYIRKTEATHIYKMTCGILGYAHVDMITRKTKKKQKNIISVISHTHVDRGVI